MRILYAIQGTGNGHVARASEIVPILNKIAPTDVLLSGIQFDIDLPFEVKYRMYGISFIFGTRGGIDLLKTLWRLRPIRFLKDIWELRVHNYDVVITDFEPVSAWACLLKGKKAVGLSHQNAVLNRFAPQPTQQDLLGKLILKYYAPCSRKLGFHFKKIDKTIFTPVIRKSIREARPSQQNHYTVYLPSYSNLEIQQVLSKFRNANWEVFSKHCSTKYKIGNTVFRPISLQEFNKSFISCIGILCNAGFETPAEALFMGKKLCVIPMKHQYEQACNAEFLNELGVLVLPELRNHKQQIRAWINTENMIKIDYEDETEMILRSIISGSSFCNPVYNHRDYRLKRSLKFNVVHG